MLGGISSGFDQAGNVLDGIDKVRVLCNDALQIYDQHPDPAAHPQVAGALIRKAFTLKERGRYAEALSVYDELVHRFGADTDPVLREMSARARSNKTVTLGRIGARGSSRSSNPPRGSCPR